MSGFNSPTPVWIDHCLSETGMADRIAQRAIDVLITGKFIALFALPFGIGLGIQADRAAH